MTRLLLVLLPLALLGGCVREHLRPVATARRLGSELLACADPEVHSIPDGAWGDDPIADGESYLVRGCGREAWFQCAPAFSTLEEACVEMPSGPYVSPHESEPHAVVLMDVRSTHLGGAGTRELIVLGDDGWVVRQTGGAPGIPVRPGRMEVAWGAQPMRIETQQHSALRTYGNSTYVHYWTTQHRVADTGCQLSFGFDPQPGAVYRLQLDLAAPGTCSVRCAREHRGPGGPSYGACEGFDPS